MYTLFYLVHVCQLVQVISLYCSLVTHNLLYLLHHSKSSQTHKKNCHRLFKKVLHHRLPGRPLVSLVAKELYLSNYC